MVNSWPRKTRKEMEEKTTERTMRAWTDCSQSLSLVAAHSHVFVALSWKQLYQRSVISESAHTHQDFSRVAMRSMAKVTKCSTVRDTSRKTMAALRCEEEPGVLCTNSNPVMLRQFQNLGVYTLQ